MSSASRSLLRRTAKFAAPLTRRPISSFNKTPPAANKGPGASEQAMPLGPYYEAIIVAPQPIPAVKPEEPPTSSPESPRSTTKKTTAAAPEKNPGAERTVDTSAAPVPTPSSEPKTAQEKAKIIFGSALAGPAERAERLKAIKDRSTLIAGVLVPPRPEEPDNCCMSGCVNCVWDRYRDEVEEWAFATAKAERTLQKQRAQGPVDVMGGVGAVKGQELLKGPGAAMSSAVNEALSMDDDGGGSDTNWDVNEVPDAKISKNLWDEDLYKGVPVGIREFMRTEKKLKNRHAQEDSVGG
ncbi:oxidoreductase-like protein [Pseudomassariella vexata]|uniref:Oxidoreductase-like protein n=1 Tax=Pseudomassariella vexata TaxID=1141098 RepID=A0A1Y2DR48_9PEZI|nr:oxidoreductase-like protein [Pseudomassariella vexata]ORY61741.1 oxidoreductase-like protein [Pseudomassariella vexata]